MRIRCALLVLIAAALGITACDSPKKTVETLRSDIAEYKANPTDAQEQKIDAEFAKLDTQIEQLESKGESEEVLQYRASEDNLRSDYRSARILRSMKKAENAVKEVGNAFKEAGQTIGDMFRKEEPTPAP